MQPTLSLQVAERSLFLWNNEYIVSLVAQHRHHVLPLVFGALERNARNHWNPAVHGLTCNVRKMFQDMDAQLYEDCRRQYEEQEVGASCLLKQQHGSAKFFRQDETDFGLSGRASDGSSACMHT